MDPSQHQQYPHEYYNSEMAYMVSEIQSGDGRNRVSSNSSSNGDIYPSEINYATTAPLGPTIVPLQLELHRPVRTDVLIQQKLRTSKGEWVDVNENDRVRVSDRKSGKNLRLLVRTTATNLDLAALQIYTYDRLSNGKHPWQRSGAGPESFTETSRSSPQCLGDVTIIEVEVKLVIIYRTVKFEMIIPPLDATEGAETVIVSYPFITYNSGSEETKKKANSTQKLESKSPQSFEKDWNILQSNLNVEGVARAQHFLQYSDIRLKTDIRELTSAAKIVLSLQGKSYRWKADLSSSSASTDESDESDEPNSSISSFSSDETKGHRVLGFIAQELQKIVPDAVKKSDDGFLVVSYTTLVPILIEAFKEQYLEARKLKSSVSLSAAELEQSQLETLQLLRKTVERLEKVENKPQKRSETPGKAVEVKMPPTPSKSSQSSQNRKLYAYPLFWIALVVVIGAAVAVGVVFGLRAADASNASNRSPGSINGDNSSSSPSSVSPSASGAPAPVAFTPSNYLNNQGFENPDDPSWNGNQSYYEYGVGKRTIAETFPTVDLAPTIFGSGRYAARLYINPASTVLANFTPSFTRQDLNMTAVQFDATRLGLNQTLQLRFSAWFNLDYVVSNPLLIPTLSPFVRVVPSFLASLASPWVDQTPFQLNLTPNLGWRLSNHTIALPAFSIPTGIRISFLSTAAGSIFLDNVNVELLPI